MSIPNNGLLRALRPVDYALLSPHLERITLERGTVLFQPGEDVRNVYFPCDGAMLSLVVVMENGVTAETAAVGREGALGGIVSQGFVPAFTRAVAQLPGRALRLDAAQLAWAKAHSATLSNLFARYADCLIAQVLQSVACNALHPIEQRAARWLLSTHDRVGNDDLPLTQEFLAEMLGVQRTYVTKVASALQNAGFIRYHRGVVTIVDRPGLEKASCECYGAVREHFDRVLAGIYPDANELGVKAG